MSRIISGQMRIEMQAVDLPALVEAALDSIRPAADAKQVAIESVLEPMPGRCAAIRRGCSR
jgi:signal transduction histidine kinase